jgi:hypothetical protein
MQAPGDLVAVVVELTAGVQHGHDDLGRRHALFLVDVDRDAAAVVGHRDRAVLMQDDRHFVGVAGERLVDGVVDHLEHHVVQPGAVMDVADVHARALAHGVKPAQDGNFAGIVVEVGGGGRWSFGAGVQIGLVWRHAVAGSHDARSGAANARRDSLAMDACSIPTHPRRGGFMAWAAAHLQLESGRVPRGTPQSGRPTQTASPAVRCR